MSKDSRTFAVAGTCIALGVLYGLQGSFTGWVFALIGAAIFLLPDEVVK